MTKNHVIIYCDGACLGNPGPGGYAALLMLKGNMDQERVVSGYETSTTNNRMELRAAIEGLKALKRPCHAKVYCDSQYVIKGITEWMPGWMERNFRGANNKPIKNVDLWHELVAAKEGHVVTWQWVKGHAGNELNERVDEIAREQAGLALHSLRGGT